MSARMAYRLTVLALLLGMIPCALPAAADRDPDPEPPLRKVICAIRTNHGTIKVELFPDKAPVTVKNFLAYVGEKHYDGTIFHRVISTFMIQGGGYQKGFAGAQNAAAVRALEKKTRKAIRCESANGLSNKKYTLAMARTVNPDSATAQFFINVQDNVFLDRSNAMVGYCVFGKVIAGMDVVDRIKKVPTKNVDVHQNVPAADVVIESIRRISH